MIFFWGTRKTHTSPQLQLCHRRKTLTLLKSPTQPKETEILENHSSEISFGASPLRLSLISWNKPCLCLSQGNHIAQSSSSCMDHQKFWLMDNKSCKTKLRMTVFKKWSISGFLQCLRQCCRPKSKKVGHLLTTVVIYCFGDCSSRWSQGPHREGLLSRAACPARYLGPPPALCPKYCILHTASQPSVDRAALHELGHKVGERLGCCTAAPRGVTLSVSKCEVRASWDSCCVCWSGEVCLLC